MTKENTLKAQCVFFQTVEKVVQSQNGCSILFSALAALANFSHIPNVCSLICSGCRLALFSAAYQLFEKLEENAPKARCVFFMGKY